MNSCISTNVTLLTSGNLLRKLKPHSSKKIWNKVDDDDSGEIDKGDELDALMVVLGFVYIDKMAHDENQARKDVSRERMEHVMSGLRNFIIRHKMGPKKHSITLEEFQKQVPNWIIEYSKKPNDGLPCTVDLEGLDEELRSLQAFIEDKRFEKKDNSI